MDWEKEEKKKIIHILLSFFGKGFALRRHKPLLSRGSPFVTTFEFFIIATKYRNIYKE